MVLCGITRHVLWTIFVLYFHSSMVSIVFYDVFESTYEFFIMFVCYIYLNATDGHCICHSVFLLAVTVLKIVPMRSIGQFLGINADNN